MSESGQSETSNWRPTPAGGAPMHGVSPMKRLSTMGAPMQARRQLRSRPRSLRLRGRGGDRQVDDRRGLVRRGELGGWRRHLRLRRRRRWRSRGCRPRRRGLDTSLRSDLSPPPECRHRPNDTGADQQKRDDQRPPRTRARWGLGRHQAQAAQLAFAAPIQRELVRLANPDRFNHSTDSLSRSDGRFNCLSRLVRLLHHQASRSAHAVLVVVFRALELH